MSIGLKDDLEELTRLLKGVYKSEFNYDINNYYNDHHHEPIGYCLRVLKKEKQLLGVYISFNRSLQAQNEIIVLDKKCDKGLIVFTQDFLKTKGIDSEVLKID